LTRNKGFYDPPIYDEYNDLDDDKLLGNVEAFSFTEDSY